jgi:hypothetical protein
MKIPRNTGRHVDDPYQPEIEHFGNCPVCGALVDMRDLPHCWIMFMGRKLNS